MLYLLKDVIFDFFNLIPSCEGIQFPLGKSVVVEITRVMSDKNTTCKRFVQTIPQEA